ncbi:MAG TPA: hypothetical protein VE974_16355 [Thermoanaerobaculia bacterium]|nr:hypothetical protein [Thermoanaerobaculia bacterium]
MQIRTFERAFTRHFLPVTIGSVSVAWGVFFATMIFGASLDDAATIIDASFKIAAVIIGTAWALNRYFTARTDVLQLRIDPVVETVSASGGDRIFICRLDVVNTGKALTPPFTEVLELYSAEADSGEVAYRMFHRWPDQVAHPVGPIEPGSWSAVSTAVVLPRETPVVQAYLELQFETGDVWTWHRHFAANGVSSHPGIEAVHQCGATSLPGKREDSA